MAVALNIPGEQTISPLDAIWTLVQSQKKSVQKALAKRLNAALESDKKVKVKMTEAEFYAKIDASIESAKAGNVYTMGENESGDEFIDRLLSMSK